MEKQTDKYGKASRQVEDIMSDFPDVPFYQVQTRTASDGGVKDIIRTYKNQAFDLDYVKIRGEQSSVIMDGMKTVMCSPQLLCMNEQLKQNEFALVKDLLHMSMPLYQDLYGDNKTGLFAVPSMIENDKQYSFGISAIIKWEDGEIQYLNTLIMDEIGFVEETDPGRPWFMVKGIMEQKDMPEELKTLFTQVNEEQQNDISELSEYIHY
ncbi:MAG: hypothetical protein KHW81_15985 [[Clostridium] innocuum]|nr:hypothetical protein [[Clostridium] innocuum]MBS5685872.1 hypothetical protein [[Clostridium] innocuum]